MQIKKNPKWKRKKQGYGSKRERRGRRGQGVTEGAATAASGVGADKHRVLSAERMRQRSAAAAVPGI